jgi:hypothetical protein
VRKRKNVGFPNSIEITWGPKGRREFFTSFLSREDAFRLIMAAWHQSAPEKAEAQMFSNKGRKREPPPHLLHRAAAAAAAVAPQHKQPPCPLQHSRCSLGLSARRSRACTAWSTMSDVSSPARQRAQGQC